MRRLWLLSWIPWNPSSRFSSWIGRDRRVSRGGCAFLGGFFFRLLLRRFCGGRSFRDGLFHCLKRGIDDFVRHRGL